MQHLRYIGICAAFLCICHALPANTNLPSGNEQEAVEEQQKANPLLLKDRDLSEEFKNPKRKKRVKLFSTNKNLKLISARAARGDVAAMQELAKACETGAGTPQNFQKAFSLYKKAANSGYINAMYSLGRCYENGIGTPPDLDKALFWYDKAAGMGMAHAYKNAADMYQKKGGKENLEKAFELFEKGARSYVPSCIYALGCCYEEGIGVDKDSLKAVEFMRAAAALGISKAQLYMAKAYESGKSVKKDAAKALDYYMKAATRGEVEAKIFLAPKFESGDGVAKSPETAFAYYLEGAQAGDALCQKKAADFYYTNNNKDTEAYRAFFWYKKASDAGFVGALHGLGKCYENGVGIERNYDKAFEYYKEYASSTGDGLAFFELARCYEEGIGTAIFPIEAFKNYQKAAELKCSKAYAPLGECFDKGIGVEADEVKAAEYFKMAADAGDDRGVYNLAIYLYYGKGKIPSDPKQAVKTLEEHAEGNRDAMVHLIEFYSDGITADRRKAEFWKKELDKYDELVKESIDAKDAKEK